MVEVPAGNPSIGFQIRNFFRRIRQKLNPSPKCVGMSVILAWKQADVLVPLTCNYAKGAACVRSADNRLTSLRYGLGKARQFDKNHLIEAIDTATDLLSKRNGARRGVKKVILIFYLCQQLHVLGEIWDK